MLDLKGPSRVKVCHSQKVDLQVSKEKDQNLHSSWQDTLFMALRMQVILVGPVDPSAVWNHPSTFDPNRIG